MIYEDVWMINYFQNIFHIEAENITGYIQIKKVGVRHPSLYTLTLLINSVLVDRQKEVQRESEHANLLDYANQYLIYNKNFKTHTSSVSILNQYGTVVSPKCLNPT